MTETLSPGNEPAMAAKAQTKPPSGTRDFLPADLERRHFVTQVIRDVYEAHGFAPLETPTFERIDTLLGKYGDEGDQLVFKILNRGQALVNGIREAHEYIQQPGAVVVGRSGETAGGAERILSDLGLRYDLTVPLARVYAAYQGRLPSVFRRYQIQPVWRADSPGKGRFREFYQCDVDVVGAPGLMAEVEVAGAVSKVLDRLGFVDCVIRLNDRRILRALVEVAGIDLSQETAAIIALDKLDKISESQVASEMETKGIERAAAERLLSMVLGEPNLGQIQTALESNEVGREACVGLQKLLELAAHTPAKGKLQFSATLARGLGYYTGPIFEITHPALSGSLGGGGRYDGLIGMFSGKDVPAVGFALGLERMLVVMEARDMFPALHSGPEILVGYASEARASEALSLAYRLRDSGRRVELHPKKDKPGKLKKQVLERKIPELIFFGPNSDESPTLWLSEKPDERAQPFTENGGYNETPD